MHPSVPRFAASALLACAVGAWAVPVELAGQAPYAGTLNGVESDSGTTPYVQSFSALANATLDQIVWWGYRLNDQSGGAADSFDVRLDGVARTGTLTVTPDGLLRKYMLDIVDSPLTASRLSIQNDGAFEWYWQGTSAMPYVDPQPFPVAFSLVGVAAVPEPATLALALTGLAVVACLAPRRRRGH